jgi:hypothetical protein
MQRLSEAATRTHHRSRVAPVTQDAIRVSARPTLWGWLPVLSLIGALGLLVVAWANTAARFGLPQADLFFWGGLLVIYLPIAVRFCLASALGRREALGLIVLLGLLLYLAKILHSPLFFTQHDEFYHWRTANDIIQSGQLFQSNPLLPASSLYPGMEIITAALAAVSGWSLYVAGIVLIGLARLILAVALYLFYERVSDSPQIGGIAALIYMANPNFLFFLAMFKYQSLAIPFAILLLMALMMRSELDSAESQRIHWRRWTLAILLILSVVLTTHHITSYLLTGFLWLWTAAALVQWRFQKIPFSGPLGIALLALAGSLAWTFTIANVTVGYLAPHFAGALGEVAGVISRSEGAGRELFSSSTPGPVTPLWERVVGLGSVALLLGGLLIGLFSIWRRHRSQPLMIALALCASAYPLTLALRLTNRGWEIANRTSEFIFLALGLVAAVGIVAILRYPLGRYARLLVIPCFAVLFLGGIVAGWTPAWRLPGPYLPNSGPRSVEAESLAAASWMNAHLGAGNIVGADHMNTLIGGAYGEQEMSVTISGGVNTAWILYAPTIDAEIERLLDRGQIEYLVVDQRLFSDRQVARYYREASAELALQKFEQADRISLIYDSGHILIYAVGALSREP